MNNSLTLRKQVLEGEIVWDEIGNQSAYGIFFNMGQSITEGFNSGIDNSIEAEYEVLEEDKIIRNWKRVARPEIFEETDRHNNIIEGNYKRLLSPKWLIDICSKVQDE